MTDAAPAALHDDRNALLRPLIGPAAAGDTNAFERIYELTARPLLARVRAIVGESLAEDVLSDVYLQVWRGLDRFDAVRGEPMAWLLMIARTRALDRLRAEVRCHGGRRFAPDAGEEAGHTDGPEEALSRSQSSASLRACLAGLNATERAVLALAYFRECSNSEIAADMGLPLGTVKSLIRRAQIKMRGVLAPADAPSAAAQVASTPG
jgi:RNA polymerase sigma-70 factor (ECF subfamily)